MSNQENNDQRVILPGDESPPTESVPQASPKESKSSFWKEHSSIIGVIGTLLIALFSIGWASLDSAFDQIAKEFDSTRSDMTTEFSNVRSEVGNELRSVRSEIKGVREELNALSKDVGRLEGKVAEQNKQEESDPKIVSSDRY